jgi:hypothetical protein
MSSSFGFVGFNTGRGVLLSTRMANREPLMELFSGPTENLACVDVVMYNRADRPIPARSLPSCKMAWCD